jgi:hypothetical protein
MTNEEYDAVVVEFERLIIKYSDTGLSQEEDDAMERLGMRINDYERGLYANGHK